MLSYHLKGFVFQILFWNHVAVSLHFGLWLSKNLDAFFINSSFAFVPLLCKYVWSLFVKDILLNVSCVCNFCNATFHLNISFLVFSFPLCIDSKLSLSDKKKTADFNLGEVVLAWVLVPITHCFAGFLRNTFTFIYDKFAIYKSNTLFGKNNEVPTLLIY